MEIREKQERKEKRKKKKGKKERRKRKREEKITKTDGWPKKRLKIEKMPENEPTSRKKRGMRRYYPSTD